VSHEIELYIVVALLCVTVAVAVTFVNKWHSERAQRLELLHAYEMLRPAILAIRTFYRSGLLPALESQAAHLAANPDLDWRGIPSSILREDLERRYQDGEYVRAGVRLMQLMVRGAQ